jgi:hypothetical protein
MEEVEEEEEKSFSEALQSLLKQPAGASVQVLYIVTNTGQRYVFLGSPIKEADYDNINDFIFGETIDPITFAEMAKVITKTVLPH